jgi:hypothetical protein
MQSNWAEAQSKFQGAVSELKVRDLYSHPLAAEAEYMAVTALEMKSVGKIRDQLDHMVASQSQVENQLANIPVELQSQAEQLESKAAKNIDAQLRNDAEMAASILRMETELASARRDAGSQASMENQGQNFNRLLGEFDQILANRRQEVASMAASHVDLELAAARSYLDSVQQAESQTQAASHSELANTLANVSSKLDSKSPLASMLQNETMYASQAQALESRTRSARSPQTRRRPTR